MNYSEDYEVYYKPTRCILCYEETTRDRSGYSKCCGCNMVSDYFLSGYAKDDESDAHG